VKPDASPVPPTALPRPWRWLATFFGAGLIPAMPGTWGSIAAALPLLLVPAAWWPWVPLGGCVLATVLCVFAARRLPEKAAGGDPGWFVLDEAAGLWLTVLALPSPRPIGILLALLLFRVFDIWKPPPIRALERVGGGLGIVLDDLVAASYALAALLVVSGWAGGSV
jgi:phosphatidylglycerophosphatase A